MRVAPAEAASRAQAPTTQPAHMGFHWRIWTAEFAATGLLMLGGLSSVCLFFAAGSPLVELVPSESARLLLTGVLFSGCNSLLAVSPLGRLSGAHLNPAVTLAFYALRRVSRHDLAGYLGAQLAGAVVGAGALELLWGSLADSVDGGVTVPTVALPAAFALEAAMTGVLIAVILFFVSSARLARWTALAIWPLIALLVWGGAPYTGTSLNPVRSAGPALVFVSGLEHLWLYLLAPTTGAAAVALAWRLVHPRMHPKTAKIYHDPRYPCSLASEIPALTPAGRT